jgi:hypothetical protein
MIKCRQDTFLPILIPGNSSATHDKELSYTFLDVNNDHASDEKATSADSCLTDEPH